MIVISYRSSYVSDKATTVSRLIFQIADLKKQSQYLSNDMNTVTLTKPPRLSTEHKLIQNGSKEEIKSDSVFKKSRPLGNREVMTRQERIETSFTKQDNINQTISWKIVDKLTNTLIFSAYVDDRGEQSQVVVLGLQDHLQLVDYHLYCALRFPNKTEVCLNQPAEYKLISRKDEKDRKHTWTYTFKCFYGKEDGVPLSVGLSTDIYCSHNKTSWLEVSTPTFHSVNKKTFAVCIQTPLFHKNGRDLTVEFVIEAIERNQALGAEYTTVYIEDANEDIWKALNDYEKEGVLKIIKWNLPQETLINSHYHAELASIADCLYRNMYSVKYLVFTDLDEVIVPLQHGNWSDMISAIEQADIAAFQFSHIATHPNQSNKEYQRKWSCQQKNGEQKETQHPLPIYLVNSFQTPPYLADSRKGLLLRQKLIIKPELVLRMGIHSINSLLNETYQQVLVPPEIGLLYHYRTPPLCPNCQVLLQDHRLQTIMPNLFYTIRERVCRYRTPT